MGKLYIGKVLVISVLGIGIGDNSRVEYSYWYWSEVVSNIHN